jgi:hypothetical protein
VGQRAGGGVGDDLLGDRVAAVRGLGLQHREWAGDEHGVGAPEAEQPVLPGRGCGVEARDSSHDQPAGGLVVESGGERGVADLGGLGPKTSSPVCSWTKACG